MGVSGRSRIKALAPRYSVEDGDSHEREPDVGHMAALLQRCGGRLEVALSYEPCESGEQLVYGRANDQHYYDPGPGGEGAGCQ